MCTYIFIDWIGFNHDYITVEKLHVCTYIHIHSYTVMSFDYRLTLPKKNKTKQNNMRALTITLNSHTKHYTLPEPILPMGGGFTNSIRFNGIYDQRVIKLSCRGDNLIYVYLSI